MDSSPCPRCGQPLFPSLHAAYDRFFEGYLECHCGHLQTSKRVEHLAGVVEPEETTPVRTPKADDDPVISDPTPARQCLGGLLIPAARRGLAQSLKQPEDWVLKIVQGLTAFRALAVEVEIKGVELRLSARLRDHLDTDLVELLEAEQPAWCHLQLGVAGLAEHPRTQGFEATWTTRMGSAGVAWRSGRFWCSPADGCTVMEPTFCLSLSRAPDGAKVKTLFEPELSVLRQRATGCPFPIYDQLRRLIRSEPPRGSQVPVRLGVAALRSRTVPSFPTAFLKGASEEWNRPESASALLEIFAAPPGSELPCRVSWWVDGVCVAGDPVAPGIVRPVFWVVHLSAEGLDTDPARLAPAIRKRPPARLSIAAGWTREVLGQMAKSIQARRGEHLQFEAGWSLALDAGLQEQLRLAKKTDHLAGTRRQDPVSTRLKAFGDQLWMRASDY